VSADGKSTTSSPGFEKIRFFMEKSEKIIIKYLILNTDFAIIPRHYAHGGLYIRCRKVDMKNEVMEVKTNYRRKI